MLGQAAFAEGGFISGKVTKSDGKTPIAGARVVAAQRTDEVTEAGFGISTTNSAGEYVIENLLTGIYEVIASFPGFADATKSNISVVSSKVTSNIDFVLLAYGSISGRITENDGEAPISNVEVMAVDVAVGVNLSTSKTDGSFKVKELLPGKYTIRADIEGNTFSPIKDIRLEEGDDIKGMIIKAHKKYLGQISGNITEQDGVTPISGAEITKIPQNAELLGYMRIEDIYSNPDGTYTIQDLPGDTYAVQAHKAGFGIGITLVTLPEDSHVQNIDFLLMTPGSISGYIFEQNGSTPIDGATIYCKNNEFEGVPIAIKDISNAEGKYTLNDLSAGVYSIQVKAEGYALEFKSNIDVVSGEETSGRNFILGTYTGSVSGVIFDKITGEPINNTFIMVTPSGSVSEGTCGDNFTSDGLYLINGLKAGNYIAKVGAVGYKTHTEEDIIIQEGVIANVDFYLERE